MLEIPIEQLATDGENDGGQDEEALQRARIERLGLFGEKLDKLFKEQVAEKAQLEERWLKDLQQYSGEYDGDTIARIRQAGGSEAFVNLTRVKCNSTESRLADTILPTDDRNWSIEPTPRPEMRRAMRDMRPAKGPDGKAVMRNGKPLPVAAAVQELIASAKAAADLMQQEMDDQLQECGYNVTVRDVLHNATVYGTGILKGPVIRARVKKSFSKKTIVDQATGLPVERWVMDITEDLAPGAESVSPWDFFPDMRAKRMHECEFVFERHRFTGLRLGELARLPGFMPDQINEVLKTDPDTTSSGLVDQATTDANKGGNRRGRYEVIEYSGPIDKEDLIAAGVQVDPEDALTRYQGTVWFVKGVVIKAVLSMLDAGELMYDVMPLERDDSSLFGFGVPYLMRHSQKAGNSAWRMILDNARLSVGGQVVYVKSKVKPVNGDPRVAPLKPWEVTDPNAKVSDVFSIVPIQPNLQGLFELFEAVRQITDEETGLPMIAQGQQSPTVTKTAQGMSILMNSANTVLRRMVKEFDDQVTSRFIKRLYHWNMQYSDNEDAKGDQTVVALGSSSLLVKEQQTQGLMQLAALAGTNPEFMKLTKWSDLFRTIVKAMNINADGIVKTDEEVAAEDEARKNQPAPMPPEIQIQMGKLQLEGAKLELEKQEAAARLAIEQAQARSTIEIAKAKTEAEREKVRMQFEADKLRAIGSIEQARADVMRVQVDQQLALIKVATERELTLEQVRAEFGIEAMKIDSKHQLFNAEAEIKAAEGSGI